MDYGDPNYFFEPLADSLRLIINISPNNLLFPNIIFWVILPLIFGTWGFVKVFDRLNFFYTHDTAIWLLSLVIAIGMMRIGELGALALIVIGLGGLATIYF